MTTMLGRQGCSGCVSAHVCSRADEDLVRSILMSEVMISSGCTEVGAVALAAAHARTHCPGVVKHIEAAVSKDVYANANSAGIPGVPDERGLALALALGVYAGRADCGLNVFSNPHEGELAQAKQLIADNAIHFTIRDRSDIYVNVTLETESGSAQAVIHANHSNIVYCNHCKLDADALTRVMMPTACSEPTYHPELRTKTLREFIAMADGIGIDCQEFIGDGIRQNFKAGDHAYHKVDHLRHVGRTTDRLVEEKIMSGLVADVYWYVVTASGARMLGGKCAVMSSGGSGNQGVVAIGVPALIGEHCGASSERIAKGVCLSHLINAKVKSHAGMTSPQCGCSVMAAAGAAGAGVYIRGGTQEQIGNAIAFVIAGLAGVLCDGAKYGCSVKVGNSAILSVIATFSVMSPEFRHAPYGGIVADGDIDQTIMNLGLLSSTMEMSKNIATLTHGERLE